jgi:carbonic anhydrase/acetyltransferase-like protein (isoleucine patch superfamily)
MVIGRVDRLGLAFVAENAAVMGDVTLGEGVSIWFGCVLRGDDAAIRIGDRTNIQDLTMVHPDPGVPCAIGADVTVGHRAILHGRAIGDRCLIGMGAILLSGSAIGEESIIGAGAMVTEGKVIPPRSLVLGIPGRIVRRVTDQDVEKLIMAAAVEYVRKGAMHADGRFV